MEFVFYTAIASTFGLACFMLGTQISPSQLIGHVRNSKAQVGLVCIHCYVTSPALAVATCRLAHLSTPHALALSLFAVTPPTVAASVATYALNGDHALAMCASVASLLAGFPLMPALFSVQLALLGEAATKLRFPYEKMVTSLTGLFGAMFFGIAANKYLPQTTKRSLRYVRAMVIVGFLVCVTSFVMSPRLTEGVPFSWLTVVSICGYIYGHALIIALSCVFFRLERVQAIAVICTATRKNPGISLAIGALTFRSALGLENGARAIGLLSLTAIALDVSTFAGLVVARVYDRLRIAPPSPPPLPDPPSCAVTPIDIEVNV